MEEALQGGGRHVRKNKVTSGDVCWGIYQFFQKAITCDEVNLIKARSEDDYRKILEACYQRVGPHSLVWQISQGVQGVKRIDCREDRTAWWGLWPVWAPDGTWCLHLGLMVSSRA